MSVLPENLSQSEGVAAGAVATLVASFLVCALAYGPLGVEVKFPWLVPLVVSALVVIAGSTLDQRRTVEAPTTPGWDLHVEFAHDELKAKQHRPPIDLQGFVSTRPSSEEQCARCGFFGHDPELGSMCKNCGTRNPSRFEILILHSAPEAGYDV